MVVAWAEVNGGEVTVLELRRQGRIAPEQRAGAVVVALGLEDLVPLDGAELAHCAIYGADQVGCGQWAGAVAQGTGEEFVEGGVGRGVGVGGFAHVHAVARDEAADHGGGPTPSAQAGQPAHEGGEGLLGQEVLRENGEAVGHSGVR